ncbi:LysM peptidoglycan-binding domain-containing protein [Gemmatimonas sp.]|uniref:LysM peptidoglycan-binding domain-containing protein n=1 Tax=Gemmatimonas sp. TaxID=1962908 RepID=UPI00356717EB
MAIREPSPGTASTATAKADLSVTAERGTASDVTAGGSRGREWLGAAAAAPPVRRQRRAWVRLLVALTSSTALLGTAALVAAAAIVPPIGARRIARDAAQQEVVSQLGPDERVVARAFASQRRWTDMWRESFGVVVATDRRLLYVGAPPTPLLRPREDGPTELLVESYPYDAAFTLEPRTLFRGYVRGLVLRTPSAQVDFIVDDGSWTSALRVSQASGAARKAVTRDEEVLSATTRAPAPPAALYVPYLVRRGETLTGLARRFRTSPDVLRQLNQLSTDDIKVGQRLRVPKVEGDTLP